MSTWLGEGTSAGLESDLFRFREGAVGPAGRRWGGDRAVGRGGYADGAGVAGESAGGGGPLLGAAAAGGVAAGAVGGNDNLLWVVAAEMVT